MPLPMFLRVVASPGAAFAELSARPERHLAGSVAVFAAASVLEGALLLVSPWGRLPEDGAAGLAAAIAAYGALEGVLATALFHLAGRRLGGASGWKRAFCILFYANVPSVLALLPLLAVAGSEHDPFLYLEDQRIPDGPGAGLPGEAAYPALIGLVTAALAAWALVILVKALKALNGFGTARAVLLLAVVVVLLFIITMPVGLLAPELRLL